MREGVEGGISHLLHESPEGSSGARSTADGEHVDEEADHALKGEVRRPLTAAGHGGAHDQISLTAEALQQGEVGRQEGHEEGGSALCTEDAEAGGKGGRQGEGETLSSPGALARPGSVGGKKSALGRVFKLSTPEAQLSPLLHASSMIPSPP